MRGVGGREEDSMSVASHGVNTAGLHASNPIPKVGVFSAYSAFLLTSSG